MKQKNATSHDDTSWQSVGRWYDDLVGQKGHYYHQHVIFPHLFKLLHLTPNSSLIDLACGQGILARHLPPQVAYTGIDVAKELIQAAKKYPSTHHTFLHGDVTHPLKVNTLFTHATCILALQNIEHPEKVFLNLRTHLKPGAEFVIVLNHPCFRIPRQSSWGFDETSKMQFRKINGYMSSQKIPIQMHPGQKGSATTWSFHHPLSSYTEWLSQAGFVIEKIEEWCSDKVSTGGASRWENRARKEFPLFLAIKARLTTS